MKIEELQAAQVALTKELREKGVAFLKEKKLDHLIGSVLIPTGICKRYQVKWTYVSHRFSPTDKLYEAGFTDGYMTSITFLVDDSTGEIIDYI